MVQNRLMVCPPGAGKSVLAAPLPGIPFCAALALHREARDPEFFDETALRDPQIRALCRRVRLVPEADSGHGGTGSRVTIVLADGHRREGHAENGLLESGELDDKFLRLTRKALGDGGATALFQRLPRLQDEGNLDWLGAPPALVVKIGRLSPLVRQIITLSIKPTPCIKMRLCDL
jgi:MmgE/PrpD C-terminal domain